MSRRGGFLAAVALAGVLAGAATACESNALRPPGPAGAGGGNSRPSTRDASAGDGDHGLADGGLDHQAGEGGAGCRTADCISGHCADGVCCDTACSGPCVSCALPGRLGACSPIPAGKPDPRALCVDQGASSCGHDGTCDGQGGCGLYAAGVSCTAAICGTGTCDGAGSCQLQTVPCVE